ncbi:FMN-binding protein [bacterium]|nr:FMN-binding protein [bacterium]
MFQPTFISQTKNGCKYVTKCDCIVYLNSDECYLIEVKGSSKSKLINFLDMLFQKFVLENSYLKVNNYLLCLIECKRGEKSQIPFIIDEFINLDKNKADPDKPDFNKIKDISILYQKESDFLKVKEESKTGKESGVYLNDVLNIVFNESFSNKQKFEESKIPAETIDKCKLFLDLGKTFYQKIDEIAERKMIKDKISELVPCDKCNSKYKDCQFKNQCRELFKTRYLNNPQKNQEYFPYNFSGSVFKSQLKAYNEIQKHPIDINNFGNFKSLISKSYFDLFDGEEFKIDETKLNIL